MYKVGRMTRIFEYTLGAVVRMALYIARKQRVHVWIDGQAITAGRPNHWKPTVFVR